VIALLTVVGAVKEIDLVMGKRDVGLQDLLLMFLYVEVLRMVGIYLDSKQIPITLPIFIAITALARMAILQREQEPVHIILRSALYSHARDRCLRCQSPAGPLCPSHDKARRKNRARPAEA
jgi:uncharacterized membrane protein (DUF373 family)